jgi:DNA-binding NarL/FixJ family response regulator
MAAHGVLLVEDDPNTRARIAAAVEQQPSLRLIAAASCCAEARAELDRGCPDVLITDLGLPDGNGIELIRELRRRGFPTLALVCTVFGDERHVVESIEAGALGYLLKDDSSESLGASILEMIAGGSPISPPIARYLLRRFQPEAESPAVPAAGAAAGAEAAPRLSEREHEVLRLIVKGFTYSEIAGIMKVSTHTVTTHVRNIYRKLAVHSRGEAVYEALQLGLVTMDG